MQLKLFQYKQVEQPEPTQGDPPKRRSCCCGRLFVTACLVALLITFVAFVVPQLYSGSFNDDVAEFNARYGDASSESSDEQLDIAIKEALRGRQMTKDQPIIRPLVIRPESDEEVDSVEAKIDAKQEKLEKMLEQELARVEQMGSKNIDDRFVSNEDDKQDRADIRARIQELMRQKASKNDDDLCDGVRSCLVDYYSIWDIDASDVLPPYVKFFDKLQDNFEHLHEFAIDIICLAQEEATNCMSMELAENSKLTADDLDECLSVAGWMENFGLKKLDAREYAADLRVRGYECRNEKFLKENFKCLYPTTQTRKADLDVCSAALREAIAVKGEACEAMDEYITCSREIFAEECGDEVSSFVCNLVQTAMLFNYPMCRDDFQTCQ